jgi:hypothetical protein
MRTYTSFLKASLTSMLVVWALAAFACGGGGKDSAAQRGGSDPIGVSPTVAQSTQPTATLTTEDEVLAAYMQYVDAYKQALFELDAKYVDGYAAGAELQSIRQEIDKLRTQGVALKVVLTHNPVVAERTANSAVVVDEMINSSFYVDAKTKQPPVASGSGEVLRNSFRLERVNNRWVVTQAFRQE